MLVKIFLTSSMLLSSLSLANAPDEEIKITFKEPTIQAQKNAWTEVRLYGIVNRSVDLSIVDKSVVYVNNNRVYSPFRSQDFVKRLKVHIKENRFLVQMILPKGLIQFRLQATDKVTGENIQKKISLLVMDKQVKLNPTMEELKAAKVVAKKAEVPQPEMEPVKEETSTLRTDYKNKVSLGVGYNYLKYQQKIDSPFVSSLEYQSFKGPGFYFEYLRSLNKKWKISGSIKNAVGKTSSAETVVRKGDYQWLTSSLEGIYLNRESTMTLLGKTFSIQPSLRMGIQYHIEPYLYRVGSQEVSVGTNDIGFASVGGGIDMATPSKLWSFESFLRFQYPLNVGSAFDLSSPFSFDGSLGLNRQLGARWQVGSFWYGQYQVYDVSGIQDQVTSLNASGNQSLFYSNIEIRLSYLW